MRRNDDSRQEYYGTGFPLLVIGTGIAVITLYLLIGGSLINGPSKQARVFVPTQTLVVTRN
jgi:hypothetical protein